MKVGDMVQWSTSSWKWSKGEVGMIVDFDEDDDPIVMWGTVGDGVNRVGEYRNQIELIDDDEDETAV